MDHVKNSKKVLWMVLPCLLLYTVVQIFPLVESMYYSFFNWKGFGPKEFVGFANYIKLFTTDPVLPIALKNTFMFAALSILIMLPLSFLLAVAIRSVVHFSSGFTTIVYAPGIISTVIVGLIWSTIFNADTGIINAVLCTIGLENCTKVWLGDPNTAMFIIILINIWQWSGYHALIFYSSLTTIPAQLYEAASIDGASSLHKLTRITLPLMANSIVMNAMLIIIGSFKCFDIVYTMTNGGPADATQMLATYMYSNTFRRSAYGYGSAISVVIFLLCVIFTVILQRVKFDNTK